MSRLARRRLQVVVLVALMGGLALSLLSGRFFEEKTVSETSEPSVRQLDVTHAPRHAVNVTWVKRRKELLADPSNVRKVIIFAYMRGGSSIIGRTFGHDDAAFYWYEPLDQFYTDYYGFQKFSIPLHITYTLDGKRRIPGDEETHRLSQFFLNLYSCRFKRLPREMFLHPFMGYTELTTPLRECDRKSNLINSCKNLLSVTCKGKGVSTRDIAGAIKYGCSERIDALRDNNMPTNKTMDKKWSQFQKHEECMDNIFSSSKACVKDHLKRKQCTMKNMQVSKVLRLNMETAEQILHAMPDAHIIHYYRDPRAIASSASKLSHIAFASGREQDLFDTQVEIVCRKMEQDIMVRKKLEQKYPGAFATLSYEDLVIEPDQSVPKIYSFLKRKVPDSLWTFLKSALSSDGGKKETSFSLKRRNATETAMAWMKQVPKSKLDQAKEKCKAVLAELGYPLDAR